MPSRVCIIKMGTKKGGSMQHSGGQRNRKASDEELVCLNDRLLAATALTPLPKDLQSSSESIYDLVEQIRRLQSTKFSPNDNSNRGSYFREFIDWCSENGIQGDKVELAVFEDSGVGLRATQKIQQHEMFLCVPRRIMMTTHVELSPIGALLKTDPIASRMPNIALSLYLLCEKLNRSSSWKPYLDVLPRSYDTPLYFSPRELLLLKGSSAYEQAIGMQRNIGRQYSYFWALFNNQVDKYPQLAKSFTYDLYRWAVSTVMTRQNIIPVDKSSAHEDNSADTVESSSTLALIPFWDMCNHKAGEMLTDFDEELGECHCYANTVYEPGNQVFICYGTRPNSDFFVHNGFVDLENSHNSVQLKLGLSKSDQFLQTRKSILEKYRILTGDDAQVFYLTKSAPHVPDSLLTFLRIFTATNDDLDMVVERESDGQSHDVFQPISDDNDRKCWSYIRDRCNLLLKTYTGDFSAVEGLDNRHVAIMKVLIDDEKLIIAKVIEIAEEKLKQ